MKKKERLAANSKLITKTYGDINFIMNEAVSMKKDVKVTTDDYCKFCTATINTYYKQHTMTDDMKEIIRSATANMMLPIVLLFVQTNRLPTRCEQTYLQEMQNPTKTKKPSEVLSSAFNEAMKWTVDKIDFEDFYASVEYFCVNDSMTHHVIKMLTVEECDIFCKFVVWFVVMALKLLFEIDMFKTDFVKAEE